MRFLIDMMDEWAAEQDEDLERVFTKFYGRYTLKLALIFTGWKRNERFFTIFLIFFYTYTLIYHFILLTISLFYLLDDFEQASVAALYDSIYVFILVAIPVMNINRRVLGSIHRALGHGIGKYLSEEVYKSETVRLLESNKNRDMIRFLLLPFLVTLLSGFSLIIPYIRTIGDPPKYNSRGVNMNLPIPAIFPHYTHEGIGHLVGVSSQSMSAASIALSLTVNEIVLYKISQEIIFELNVLRYGIRTVMSRASILYKERYPKSTAAMDISNVEFQKCIGSCLENCVAHHHQILDVTAGLQIIINWPAAVGFGVGTAFLGLSLINLLFALTQNSFDNLLLFGFLAIAACLNVYVLCFVGESISTESEKLRETVSCIDWDVFNVPNRKIVLMFQTGVTNPLIIKGGDYVVLCMDTFSSIINTSYSFFNLMYSNR